MAAKKAMDKFKVPRKCQDVFPIKDMYKTGICSSSHNGNRYNKTWRLDDINYATLADEVRKNILKKYAGMINSFSPESTVEITIVNHRMNEKEIENNIFMKPAMDGHDDLRQCYNRIFKDKISNINSITQDKYITVSCLKRNYNEARMFFEHQGDNIKLHAGRLKTEAYELDANDKVSVLHDIFRNVEDKCRFDLQEIYWKGHDVRDVFTPDYFNFRTSTFDYFQFDKRFGRVLYLRDYATYVRDELLNSITELQKDLIVSLTFTPYRIDETVKTVEEKMLKVDSNITKWQNRQNKHNNFSAKPPHVFVKQQEMLEEIYDEITGRDQHMFEGMLTIVHFADSLEELDEDTETLMEYAKNCACELGYLEYQQMEGLQQVLPLGEVKLELGRTFLTDNLAIVQPFKAIQYQHKGGTYIGQNSSSKELIMVDRDKLQNGNQFITGTSGSGKSLKGKDMVNQIELRDPDADIIIIDPDREYGDIVREYGGEIANISTTSQNYINALDISESYDDKNPIVAKADFVAALCEMIMPDMTAQHHSIVNQAVKSVYKDYVANGYTGDMPTLIDLRNIILQRQEPQAMDIALALEKYTTGTVDFISKQTNTDTDNSMLCYDIYELSDTLLAIAMLVIFDNITMRVVRNRAKGKRTYVIFDEFHIIFRYLYGGRQAAKLWSRIRKYGGYCIGITQNVSEALANDDAAKMIANSDFVIMLNQSEIDRIQLKKLFNLDDTQLEYITDADVGCGLAKIGKSLIPFEDNMPKDTKLYKLCSTKPFEQLA